MEYDEGPIGGSSGPKGIRMFGGMIYVTASAETGIDRAQRDVKGRFVPAVQRFVAETNRRMAQELADDMADRLQASLVRDEASTGRLKRALLDPRNRSADQFGFGVGDVDFLDNSEAKYWRAIEQGTTHFVGRKLTGVWGDMEGTEFSPFGPRTKHERLYPKGPVAARMLLRAAGYDRSELNVTGVIEEPIHAHRYMQGAWDDFDMHVRAAQLFREIVRELR